MKKSIEIMKVFGEIIWVVPFEQLEINWNNVTPSFANSFMKEFKKANHRILTLSDEAERNVLNKLGCIGWLINRSSEMKHTEFQDVFNKETRKRCTNVSFQMLATA